MGKVKDLAEIFVPGLVNYALLIGLTYGINNVSFQVQERLFGLESSILRAERILKHGELNPYNPARALVLGVEVSATNYLISKDKL